MSNPWPVEIDAGHAHCCRASLWLAAPELAFQLIWARRGKRHACKLGVASGHSRPAKLLLIAHMPQPHFQVHPVPPPVRPEEPGPSEATAQRRSRRTRSKTEARPFETALRASSGQALEGSRSGGSRRAASTFGLDRPSSPRTDRFFLKESRLTEPFVSAMYAWLRHVACQEVAST